MTPPSSARLAFRQLTEDDLDDMAALLGDPVVMTYYPRVRDRGEALEWIHWNQRLYRAHGFGLWRIALRETDEFVGDCGITPQNVAGRTHLELGYHVRADRQGLGYATEAALACRDHARDALGIRRLIAIINPANIPSQRVAEKIGLHHTHNAEYHGAQQRIHAADL